MWSMSLSRRSSPSVTTSMPTTSWSFSTALIAMSCMSDSWVRLTPPW
jgi:hypothetical protein